MLSAASTNVSMLSLSLYSLPPHSKKPPTTAEISPNRRYRNMGSNSIAKSTISSSLSSSQPSKQLPSLLSSPSPIIGNDAVLLKYVSHQLPLVMIPTKEDEGTKRREYLLAKTARELQTTTQSAVEKLKLIDTIQRLGIGYYFEEDINAILQIEFSNALKTTEDNDLFTTALRFRLLRHNGFQITSNVFFKFMDKNRKFKESLSEDTLGLLSLYEASYMGANGEEVLEEAMKFTKDHLQQSVSHMPRHLRMARLEARQYIERYAAQSDCDTTLLELATLDYNKVQAQHQIELAEITRWWRQLGLVEKLTFARDRPLECFLWTVGLLPEPKYSTCRIELAKTIAILLVIDDIFDTYGKMDELVLFTDAIRRWDLEAMETLPEYMKICYMALYNTTNEIWYKVLKDNGWSVLPYLKSTWIDMIEGFMVEAKWFNGGNEPNLEEYIENGVSTAGAYMAFVHLFFLIGEGVTQQNSQLLIHKPYPKLFSFAGRILRLWDDLGTSKEELERGDLASSIHLLMREKNIGTEEEGRKRVLEEIYELWKDLNGEMMSENRMMPLPIINVALNMARASQVVYNHEEETYFSNVDNYVEALFFTPIA